MAVDESQSTSGNVASVCRVSNRFSKGGLIMLRSLALIFLCATAAASPPLTITQSGYYLTVIDANGNPSLERIATVIDLRDGGIVPDVPPIVITPEPPPVVVDAALVAEIKAAAVAIQDPSSAQGISLAYTQIRDAFGDGLVSPESVWPVLKTATDSALVVTAGKDWKPFRSKLSAIITARKQQGLLDGKDEIIAYLTAIKAGLEQAAEGSAAISFADTIKIVKATNEAIDAN